MQGSAGTIVPRLKLGFHVGVGFAKAVPRAHGESRMTRFSGSPAREIRVERRTTMAAPTRIPGSPSLGPRWRSRTVRPTDAPAHCIGLRTPVRLTSKNDTPHTPPGCPAPPSGEGGITGRRPSPECGTVLGRAGPAGLGWPFTRQVVFVISSANSLPWFLVCVFGVAAVGFDWPLPAGQLVLEHPYLGREAGKLPATGCFGCFRPSIGCGGHTFHEPGG